MPISAGVLPVAGRDDPHPHDAASGQKARRPAELSKLLPRHVQELEEGLELPLLDRAIELELPDPPALQVEPEGLERRLDGTDVRPGPDEAIGLHAERETEPLLEEVRQRAVESADPGRGDLAPGRIEAE